MFQEFTEIQGRPDDNIVASAKPFYTLITKCPKFGFMTDHNFGLFIGKIQILLFVEKYLPSESSAKYSDAKLNQQSRTKLKTELFYLKLPLFILKREFCLFARPLQNASPPILAPPYAPSSRPIVCELLRGEPAGLARCARGRPRRAKRLRERRSDACRPAGKKKGSPGPCLR